MHGVLQLVRRELPYAPPALAGVALLALFVAAEPPGDTPNGVGWRLRTYDSLAGLDQLRSPEWASDPRLPKGSDPALKPFPLAFSAVDDPPEEPHTGLKVGGWPYPVQDEVEWYEHGAAVPGVELAVQVDSDYKVGFAIADNGMFYVGHRAESGTWHATVQSY
jgi:hypothetical protein